MSIFDTAGDAILRIEHDGGCGSGFHFLNPETVITNYHVIAGAENSGKPIRGYMENGVCLALKLIASSPADQHDFAVLKIQDAIPTGRTFFKPRIYKPPRRGLDVIFAGFPHGINHLLVQRAVIAGLINDDVFYIDGSINGGNSGGPIINIQNGTVIGIVTQRRFLGDADLNALGYAAEQIRARCQSIASQGAVANFMGIDFFAFSNLMAEGTILIQKVLKANANTGIGIGFSIEFVTNKCADLDLK
ncbi:MAG: serine protease [Thermoguttaceae bacterium]